MATFKETLSDLAEASNTMRDFVVVQAGSEAGTTSLEGSSLRGPICGCNPSQGTG